MLTTVGAFGALIFSRFIVFREFGVVGALGIFLNYLSMVIVLPSLLVLSHRFQSKRASAWFSRLNRMGMPDRWEPSALIQKLFAPRWAGMVTLVTLCLLGLSAISLPRNAKIVFEDGQTDNQELPGNRLYNRVTKLTGGSLDPTVLMTQGLEDESKVVEQFNQQLEKAPANSLIYKKVVGLSSFIPQHQQEKREIIGRLLQKFQEATLINKSEKAKILRSLKTSLAAAEVSAETLPVEIQRLFRAVTDPNRFAVYLFPNIGRSSSEDMQRYNEGILAYQKKLDLHFVPMDASFISKDIIDLINREAPGGLFLVVVFLALVIFFTIRPLTRALLILFQILGSLILLSGVLYLTGLRVNIMNIAVVPIILGTGIDCFIHFSHRYDETRDIDITLRDQIPSILVSNLTSIVGFGGLILTTNVGLRSVGWVAVIGLSIVTLLCVFIFPRSLALLSSRKVRVLKMEEDIIRA
jgi:uncharacterized protein